MLIFDIILVVIFIWSLYSGFRNGVIVELGGLAGLFLGIYLAFRLGKAAGQLFNIDPSYSHLVGFVIVLVLVLIGVAVLTRIFRSIFRAVGLGVIDRIGGSLLSLAKAVLITGLIIYSFNSFNQKLRWVDESKLSESTFYYPLNKVTTTVFPYLTTIKDMIFDQFSGRDE